MSLKLFFLQENDIDVIQASNNSQYYIKQMNKK